ncbi:hypothetical protein [Ponticaulis sp.]|uniref:hypothetical protein n=1 Tax=Ponticaulis sp. TaxID=2020902 RepID=UPI000C413056|nr:hypothetical protein [Ponticaulis sp.]MAF58891.1 hypothetical protein [Ponticaulis sp.]MBN03851.1 hypothetical protein [Ponticaulis sp.]
MTHNPKRVPYTAQTKAKVRKLREEGYSNVQITEATGVPASTIARWAAEGKWRVKDLVEEPAFNVPETPPLGLLPGLGGESWVGSRDPDGSHRTRSGLHSQLSDQRDSPEPVSSRDPGPDPGEAGDNHQTTPEKNDARAQQKARQARLEDALTNAARAAEEAIMRGNFAAAAKATQMADTLSRSLERVRVPEEEEQPDGVFYSFEQIAAARAELMRRLDRIAATIRPDEMVDSGFE